MRIFGIALVFLIPFSLYASARSNSGGLAERVFDLETQMERVTELEAQVEVLAAALQEAQEILQFVRVETEEMNFLAGPHWIIEGANVHVRSGGGSTIDGCGSTDPDFPNCEALTGLGNLIVGYNEKRPSRNLPPENRTGSHNLVLGPFQAYSSFGGFVAGSSNEVTGRNASVCGGTDNKARGAYASVSGGEDRVAPDENNWVAGGLFEPN
jgi:hypothetical protein